MCHFSSPLSSTICWTPSQTSAFCRFAFACRPLVLAFGSCESKPGDRGQTDVGMRIMMIMIMIPSIAIIIIEGCRMVRHHGKRYSTNGRVPRANEVVAP